MISSEFAFRADYKMNMNERLILGSGQRAEKVMDNEGYNYKVCSLLTFQETRGLISGKKNDTVQTTILLK